MGHKLTIVSEVHDLSGFNNPNQMLADCAEFVSNDVKKRIRSQTDTEGVPFAPITDSTLKQRKSRGSSKTRALMDTGRLLAGISFFPVGQNGYVVSADNSKYRSSRARVLSAKEITTIHDQLGASTKRIIRKFFGVSLRAETYIKGRVDRFLNQQLRKSVKGRVAYD